jgi:hypothetical protein
MLGEATMYVDAGNLITIGDVIPEAEGAAMRPRQREAC